MQHFFRTLPGQAKSSAFRLLDVLLYVPSNCAPKLSIAHLVNIFYLDKKTKLNVQIFSVCLNAEKFEPFWKRKKKKRKKGKKKEKWIQY